MCLRTGAKQRQARDTAHLSSDEQLARHMRPTHALISARSAPEANFCLNSQKCQNPTNCVEFSNPLKIEVFRAVQILKHVS